MVLSIKAKQRRRKERLQLAASGVDNAVRTLPDGREICNDNVAGIREYKSRTHQMADWQHWVCCLHGHAPMCPGRMAPYDVTFDHEGGRGMNGGKRDDRIALPNGKRQNGAAHRACNNWKGSRVIRYNEGFNNASRNEDRIR